MADKLAFVLTPDWLYLPLARASGELIEYTSLARERQAGNDHFTPEEAAQLSSADAKVWLQGLKSYTLRWVMEHRVGGEDTWTTADTQDVIGAVKNEERGLRDSTQSLPEERAVPVADAIEIEISGCYEFVSLHLRGSAAHCSPDGTTAATRAEISILRS